MNYLIFRCYKCYSPRVTYQFRSVSRYSRRTFRDYLDMVRNGITYHGQCMLTLLKTEPKNRRKLDDHFRALATLTDLFVSIDNQARAAVGLKPRAGYTVKEAA